MHLGIQASLGSAATSAVDDPLVNNTYSLAFDGTDDYIATSGDGTLADATYSFWLKSTETGSNYGVFGHGADKIGAFHINVGGTPYLAMRGTGGDTRKFWTDISAQDDGNWHHWVVYIDSTSIVDSKLYVDAALQTATLTQGTTVMTAYSSNLTIGSSTSSYFEGSIDEFAHWDKELTSTEITAIYDNVRLNLSKDALGYESSSDLQGWWRMGDGTLDTFPLIADQVNATLGSELLGSDTDFALSGTQSASTSGTYWVTAANWSIAAGKAIYDDGGNTTLDVASATIQNAGVYKFSFDISDASSDARIKLLGDANVLVDSATYSNGSHVAYFLLASAYGSAKTLKIEGRTDAGAFKIDNVSVKPVNGNAGLMTSMAADDIESDVPS